MSPTPAPEAWVGMVYGTGGVGDGSFNDQAQQGALQAEEELGVAFSEAQPEEVADFSNFQQQFAESDNPDYDLICCIGFQQTDALTETAQDYTDQRFMLVDSVVDKSNVANYVFSEEQGSYLVGQLAGMLTTEDFSAGGGSTLPDQATVGFVGGIEVPIIEKFQAGFEAGALAANADVEILTNYTGSFNDPAAGREAGLAMYDNGADIIYHASGNTGTGVFQAAQDQGRYAIGVDRDQSVTKDSYTGVILASMVKRVDTAIFNSIESIVNDDYQGGSVVPSGLAGGRRRYRLWPVTRWRHTIGRQGRGGVVAAIYHRRRHRRTDRPRERLKRARPVSTDTGGPHQPMPTAVHLDGITKRFPGVVANDEVDFEVASGTVHALLGENGAGKTTLMNVLYGLYQPTEGQVFLDGQEREFDSPRKAIEAGIGMIHQHFKLVDPFTVTENITLGYEPTKWGGLALDRERAREEVLELTNRYGFSVDPDALIQDVSVGVQQRVEILKAIYRGAEVLILDEPTAALTPQEVQGLFQVFEELTEQGKTDHLHHP
ncbi:MAG: BMP family ABC transporter substrate-binding protein [Halobacteriales archaeon]|nr:BMP family ABC transporter substrate-binding protein [Halobacteriales archaeon]